MAESIDTPLFVVDASFVLTYLLPDESNKIVDEKCIAHENGEVRFISTDLLVFEVMNGLKTAIMRKRISTKVAKKLLIQMIELDITPCLINFPEVFSLAMSTGLTVYDASYLWLSKNRKVSLLTFDKELLRSVA